MTLTHPSTSVQIDTIAEELQCLLTQTATELARETKFVQRRSPITGATFAQALIFGWLATPDASYSQLQQMLGLLHCDVTWQALEKRMKKPAADFLLGLLHAFISQAIFSQDVEIELLKRFEGVYVQDGTIISLPKTLEETYHGFGGKKGMYGRSAIRAQVRINLSNGQMLGPWLKDGSACEREGQGSVQEEMLPEHALFLADAAYFPLHQMRWMSEHKIWWITHARADLSLKDEDGVKKTLVEYIKKKQDQKVVDEWVTLGGTTATRQCVRLVAFRVSDETARRRREQKNQRSKVRGKGSRRDVRVGKKRQRPSIDGRHGRKVSAKRLELSEWTILLTTVPAEMLAAHEVRVLMRARWQIELVWRLWKERGQVDIWRSEKDMRILCEIYAKMIGMVIEQWMIIIGCWNEPHRSRVKASMVVKLLAPSYLLTIREPVGLQEVIGAAKRAMKRAKVMNTQKRPSTSGLLLDPSRILPLS